MKGLFIPEITAEMFRNGCLESIETLMAEGEIYDIDYSLEQQTVLDKIRAEIEQHRRKTQGIDPYDLVGDCLDIIDRCKADKKYEDKYRSKSEE